MKRIESNLEAYCVLSSALDQVKAVHAAIARGDVDTSLLESIKEARAALDKADEQAMSAAQKERRKA